MHDKLPPAPLKRAGLTSLRVRRGVDGSVQIQYTCPNGQVWGSYEMNITLKRRDGKLVKSYKTSSMYRSQLVQFSVIGPWTRAYLEGNSAPLIAALQSEGNESAEAASALEDFPDAKTVRALMSTMASRGHGMYVSNNYEVTLATIVGQTRDQEVLDSAVPELHDSVWVEKTAAAKTFVGLLGFSDPSVRKGAAWMLGEVGDKTSSERLRQIFQDDKDPTVRQAAKEALRKIDRD
jgi:hypothetical protein